MTPKDHDFRQCLGRFATGVTIVTTLRKDQSPCGLTANSFTSVSLEPPLILFNLDKQSSNHGTFLKSDSFAVNILSEEQQALSQQFASPSTTPWESLSYSKEQTGCPILKGCIAYLECKKEAVYEGGDHSIFLGRVINLNVFSDKKPLLYYQGEYSTLGQTKI